MIHAETLACVAFTKWAELPSTDDPSRFLQFPEINAGIELPLALLMVKTVIVTAANDV